MLSCRNITLSTSFPKGDKPQGCSADFFSLYHLNMIFLFIYFCPPHCLCEWREQSCACDRCWWLMPDCDGALFISWMCNLPSSCLWLPTEKGFLVLCYPRQSQWLLPPPPQTPLSSLCAFTYSCPTGCSETEWHPRASEERGALLSYHTRLDGSSHSRWVIEIKPPGSWQLLWPCYCEI